MNLIRYHDRGGSEEIVPSVSRWRNWTLGLQSWRSNPLRECQPRRLLKLYAGKLNVKSTWFEKILWQESRNIITARSPFLNHPLSWLRTTAGFGVY